MMKKLRIRTGVLASGATALAALVAGVGLEARQVESAAGILAAVLLCGVAAAAATTLVVRRPWRRGAGRSAVSPHRDEATGASRADAEAASGFLTRISHEIRTPMTAVLGFSEALLDGDLSPNASRCAADAIGRNARHLLQRINDLLDLFGIEAGETIVRRGTGLPLAILANVNTIMRPKAAAKGLSFRVELDGPIPEAIQTDPARLRQILLNLADNAVCFTERGGVRLAARLTEREGRPMLECEVIDSGVGIAPEHLRRILDPLAPAPEPAAWQHGVAGLGLTLARRLAEALGGEISAESQFGCGTTFRLLVPTGPLDGVAMLDGPAAEAWPLDEERVRPWRAGKSRLYGRILLAEDGPDNQQLIAFLLRKAGADVTIAENGRAACQLVAKAERAGEPFDVVLMDIQMPVLDGYAATRELRADGFSGPIIALTACALPEDREKCLAAGCDDYAAKPIRRDQLLALVAEYLPEPVEIAAE